MMAHTSRVKSWLAARWHDVIATIRVGIVRRGFYGALLIALGALSPAYLPRSSPWWTWLSERRLEGLPAKLIGTVITMAGLLLLMDAWYRLRPRKGESADPDDVGTITPRAYLTLKHWAVLGWWSLPFIFAPPIFSLDAYSYAAQGWLVHNNISPYYFGPGVLPGAFADQVSWVWRDTPSPYGPLSMQISNLLLHMFGFDAYWSAVAQRIPALLGVVLIGVFLPRVAARVGANPAFTAWFGVLNPLLVIDFVGGAHNDSLMMGLVVLGLWFATIPVRERKGERQNFLTWYSGGWWWLVGAAVIGIGAAIKQPAFLAAYVIPLLARPWERFNLKDTLITAFRVLVSFIVAIGVFAGISVATGLYFGWANAVSVPGRAGSPAPATLIGKILSWALDLMGFTNAAAAALPLTRNIFLGAGGIALVAGAVTIAKKRPASFVSWGYLVAALSSPALHSWYMLWSGVTLPLARPKARVVNFAIWINFSLLAYDAIDMSWRNDGVAIAVAAVIASMFMTWLHQRAHRERVT